MTNIRIQCCGMVVLWLISYFYWRLPRIEVKTKKVFSALLGISNICIIIDILSVLAIYNVDSLPRCLVLFCCKLYLFCLMAMIYCGILYLFSDIYKNHQLFNKRKLQYGIALMFSEIAMLVLPIDVYSNRNSNELYSFGYSVLVTYFFFGSVFLSMCIHLYLSRKEVFARRKRAMSFWLLIWAVSALWQFLDGSLLIVTFAGILGVLIIFTMIENPELTLDKESSFFHSSAMQLYLSELYAAGTGFSLICTKYDKEEIDFYKQIKGAYTFVGGGDIYFIFKDRANARNAEEKLAGYFFRQPIYIVWDSFIVDHANELMELIKDSQGRYKKEVLSEIYSIDQELKDRINESKKIEKLIDEAISQDRVEVFYQPIFSVKEGRFQSAEALMRIRNADGNLIMPNVFIPISEAKGTIIELGNIVFDKVCDFLSRNQDSISCPDYIEVNLSVIQAEERFLAEHILETMKTHNVNSTQINLEITESASPIGRAQLLEMMQTLEEYGVTFSLDDFGTGHSNLDYIASMPVRIVKFDYSMTHNYFESEKTRSIMNAAVSMIHDMNMKIVAEGIETKEQFDCMKELGIDFIQGFYFSKPVPEKEYLSFLKREHETLTCN